MRRVLVVLCLMTLSVRGIAQNQVPDLDFFINFSGISNGAAPPSGLQGQAAYYRVKLPFLPMMPTYTNILDIYIGLPSQPEDAWILKQGANGSFLRVAPMT